MSTKSTIFLTWEDEHWFEDCAEPLNDSCNAITLDFNKANIRIDCNDDNSLIITIINPDCELYHLFSSKKFKEVAEVR